MRIELNCAQCNGNRFSLVQSMDDDAAILCSDCGHEIGTMAELKERVAQEVLRRSCCEEPPHLA